MVIAIYTSPTGPFEIQPNPIIGDLDTEGVSMWFDKEQAMFYAVFHAYSYVGLMTSKDSLDWGKVENYEISRKKLKLEEGGFLIPNRMERPFVYLENNQLTVLNLAIKKEDDSYTIFIPLSKGN
jgi:hypothetical protein